MLKCPICGTVKATNRRQRTCSRRCGFALWRLNVGPAHHLDCARAGGKAAGKKTRRRSLETWLARFPGIDPAAARAIYVQGYNSGSAIGRRKGRAVGYEQALRDSDPKYAAACDLVSRGRMREADRMQEIA